MKKSLSNGKLALIVVLSTVAVRAALAAYMLICVIQYLSDEGYIVE